MRHNGMGVIHQLFRKRIDRLQIKDKVFAPVANVQPQQLLDNTYALYEFIKNISGSTGLQALAEKSAASLLGGLFTPGFLLKNPAEHTATPSEGGYGFVGHERVYIGPNTAVIDGRKTDIPEGMSVDVPANSEQIVFIEAWLQVIDPKTGLGLMSKAHRISDEVVYPYGCRNLEQGVALEEVFSDIGIYHLHSAEPGDITRLQWQWRLRRVVGADSMLSSLVTAQGPADEPGSDRFFARGDGAFVTDSGSIIALPMFYIRRSDDLHIDDLRMLTVTPGFENAVQRAGDSMHGSLGMLDEAPVLFGNRFKMAYNEAEDSLDVTLV